jgi:hypothetical protein
LLHDLSLQSRADFVGSSVVDDRPVHVFRGELSKSDGALFYLDAATHLLYRVRESRNIQGETFEIVRTYHDYRRVDGIPLAFRLEESNAQGTRVFVFEDVAVNVSVADAQFAQPAEDARP